jgi:Lon protease-like protein
MILEHDLREFQGVVRLFPLSGVVLFPHAVLCLHVFEPRYRQLIQDALASDRLITIIQPRGDSAPLWPMEPVLEEIGCLGKILNCEELPDGRFNFLLLGLTRVKLLAEREASSLYVQAQAEVWDDMEPEFEDVAERVELIGRFRELAEQQQMLDPDLVHLLESKVPLGVLTDLVAHSLGLPPELKQILLAERRVEHRTRQLLAILRGMTTGPRSLSGGTRVFPPPFSIN